MSTNKIESSETAVRVASEAKVYLDQHLGVQELYSSSDGFLFLRKQDAESHALKLGDSSLTTHKREIKPTPQDTPD